MKPLSLLMALIFVAACAPCEVKKRPALPIQDSYWCETETCDAVLFITGLVVSPNGRDVNGPFIQRWRMPMARCQEELNDPVNRYVGPIGNLPGYSRANSAWCERYSIPRSG